MSMEIYTRKQADTHELQQARCLSQLRDGFTEETLEKLDRKIFCPDYCISFSE